MEKKTQKYFYC